MSVKAMSAVWDMPMKDAAAKFVLLAYADHADHEGGSIYPAVSTVSQKTGYDERSVRRITHRLIKTGYLKPQGKTSKGVIRYRIPLTNGQVTDGQADPESGPDLTQSPVTPDPRSANPSLTINEPSIAPTGAKKILDLESPTMTIADSTKPKAEAEPSTTAIPQSDRRAEGDALDNIFNSHLKAQANPALATVRKWNLPPHLSGICEDYVDVAKGTTVKASDKKLYIAGASDICELFKASGKTYSRAWMVKAVEATTWTHSHPRALDKTFRELFKTKWQPASTPASSGFQHVGWQKNEHGDMVQIVKAVARG